MTATKERAVAAMRAIGDTVTTAPPLRLESQRLQARAGGARANRITRLARPPRLPSPAGHVWRLWLVPAAAALAVIALAVSLVLVRSAPKDTALSPGSATPGTASAAGPDGVPPYYVTLPASFGWYAYAPLAPQATPNAAGSPQASGLVVGETATGKRLGTVLPPHGMTFNVVTGAADDRTFVVGATSYVPAKKTVSTYWTETWYLLRIAPGSAHAATLTRLPIPPVPYVTGVALSPDGTELAVAWQQFSGPSGSSASGRPRLALILVPSGKELPYWSSTQGRITARPPAAGTGSRPGPFDTDGMATALRWTPDGGGLAFAWNGSQIRLLDFTVEGPHVPDLVKASSLRAGLGTVYTPAGATFFCDATAGWSLSAKATTFDCAGSYTPMKPATGKNCGKTAPAYPAIIQRTNLPGGAEEITTLAQSSSCAPASVRLNVASLGWTGADAAKVIATLASTVLPGDARFGVYTPKTFTALPALPAIGSLATVAW